eukprot:PhM_4_TR11302/c0_g1_i1/m.46979
MDVQELENEAAGVIQRQWRLFKETARAGAEAEAHDESRELTEHERRVQLLDRYRELLEYRESVLSQNLVDQRKVARRLNDLKGTGVGGAGQASFDRVDAGADAEAKYWGAVQRARSERLELEAKQDAYDADLGAAREKQQTFMENAYDVEKDFVNAVVESAKKATFTRNNKPVPAQRIQEFLSMEEALSQRLHEARLAYIRARNLNKKLAEEMRDRDKVSSTLHLIDFEQLKIENTTLNEKIEERNEDLLKLRKKSTTTIHILTHVKEKLECVRAENLLLQKDLTALETSLAEKRDKLAQTKRERDAFQTENIRMREKMPMIGSEDLLLDFELRKKEIENRRIEVLNLTNEHHELVQKISKLHPVLESLLATKNSAGGMGATQQQSFGATGSNLKGTSKAPMADTTSLRL